MRCRSVLGFLWFSWSSLCFTGVENMMVRKRRQLCEDGTYTHNNLECCRCPTGSYVQTHCTAPRTDGKCEQCMPDTYRDYPSGEEQCERCAVCEDRANMEAKTKCSLHSNTVCDCMEGHYCDKGENCRACYTCDKCEGLGVKVPCTFTNNAVCHETPDQSGPIAAGVVSFIILCCCVVLFLWWKKKLCFKNSPRTVREDELLLEDKDLAPFLTRIAQTLGWRTVRNVARSVLTKVELENAQHDNPNDAAELTLQLLSMWHQKIGLEGAYSKLINSLIGNGERTKADLVRQIVESG